MFNPAVQTIARVSDFNLLPRFSNKDKFRPRAGLPPRNLLLHLEENLHPRNIDELGKFPDPHWFSPTVTNFCIAVSIRVVLQLPWLHIFSDELATFHLPLLIHEDPYYSLQFLLAFSCSAISYKRGDIFSLSANVPSFEDGQIKHINLHFLRAGQSRSVSETYN